MRTQNSQLQIQVDAVFNVSFDLVLTELLQ